uniref:Serine incorporator n=1 Tax=Hirondellea gigas TaxID=1518452 RepID=A0A6A7G9L1_9CRUS
MDITYMEERSCARSQCKCLCGSGACRLCCRSCPSVRESTSTRSVYVFFLMISIAVMALMMSYRVQNTIMEMFPDHSAVCDYVGAGEKCEAVLGYMAVYRLGLAITVYHLLLMALTYGVKSSRGCRAGIHNGLWFYKVMLMLGLCVAAFLIPDPHEYFIMAWMYMAMVGAALFLVTQLILLVFMVHHWTDKIVRRVNNGGSPCCWYGVIVTGVTVIAYTGCVLIALLLYYNFAWEEGCHQNQWFIVVNLMACIVVSIVTACKRGKTRLVLRLFQASLISLYVQYLTFTAISSAPRTMQATVITPITGGGWWSSKYSSVSSYRRIYCGPERDDMLWAEAIIPYLSVIIMFCAVVYASIGTAQPDNCQALEFPDCPMGGDRVADASEDDTGGQVLVRDERSQLSYSYPLFHIMLALATLFMMMSLTGWYTPTTARLSTFGRSWSAVWIKMTSSWVCLFIYLVSTLFPSIVPKKYQHQLTVAQDMMGRSPSRAHSIGGSSYRQSRNGSARSVGRGFFGSSGSLGVAERLRRYSITQYPSQHSSLDAVPLAPSEQAPTIVCHQETTV